MDLKVKIIEDSNWANGIRLKLQAIKTVEEQLNLGLKEAKDAVDGQTFFIHEGKFAHLNKLLKSCGYILGVRDRALKEEQVVQDYNPSITVNKTTVHLTSDGRISVVSHRQIEERACLFLGNNVDIIQTMLKEYFPAIKRIQVMPEKDSNNNTIRCCCIALSIGGEHNTIEDIIELGKFAAQVQENIQVIVDTCLRTGNLYKDFKGTFPE